MSDFLDQFELTSDGTVFWEAYEGKTSWLGNSVSISIAARSVSDSLIPLYQNVMAEQEEFDTLWRTFVSDELLNGMQTDHDNDTITLLQVIDDLKITALTFGFYRDDLMSVWFRSSYSQDHVPCLYCDNNGDPSVVAMEG